MGAQPPRALLDPSPEAASGGALVAGGKALLGEAGEEGGEELAGLLVAAEAGVDEALDEEKIVEGRVVLAAARAGEAQVEDGDADVVAEGGVVGARADQAQARLAPAQVGSPLLEEGGACGRIRRCHLGQGAHEDAEHAWAPGGALEARA